MSNKMQATGGAGNFAERAARLLERVEYRRVEAAADLEQILRLRYDAYLREQAIHPNARKQLPDAFDDVENAYTFGVFVDGQLASSFRINILSPNCRKSPGAEAFPDFFQPALDAGETFVDGNRFVANFDIARLFPELPYVTIRIPYMAAVHFRADFIAASVRAEHQGFYSRSFGLQSVLPPRHYPTLIKPLGLMVTNFAGGGKEHILRKHPYFASSLEERRRLFGAKATEGRVASRQLRADARSLSSLLPRMFSQHDVRGTIAACVGRMPLMP